MAQFSTAIFSAEIVGDTAASSTPAIQVVDVSGMGTGVPSTPGIQVVDGSGMGSGVPSTPVIQVVDGSDMVTGVVCCNDD